MDKRFWAIIGVVIVVFGGVYYFTNAKNKDAQNTAANAKNVTSHIDGNPKASVTLVEYGDYQCPVCGSYYPTVKQVVEKYKDDIKFQFRNFPLTSLHSNAFSAARAAEAAGLQNKYWEMHDALYENQQAWSASTDSMNLFTSYAKQLGMDPAKFKTDYSSTAVNDAINADLADAKKKNLTGTPAFYLNGSQISLQQLVENGKPSLAKFYALIDPLIKDSKTTSTSTEPAPAAPAQQ